MHLDTWLWSEEHRQLCKVIETQTLWGNTFHRIWLPNQDTVIRTRADKLKPLSDANITTPASIAYIATSARIADALTQDVLLAPNLRLFRYPIKSKHYQKLFLAIVFVTCLLTKLDWVKLSKLD